MRDIYIKDGITNILIFYNLEKKIIDHLLTNNHNIEEMAIEKQIP